MCILCIYIYSIIIVYIYRVWSNLQLGHHLELTVDCQDQLTSSSPASTHPRFEGVSHQERPGKIGDLWWFPIGRCWLLGKCHHLSSFGSEPLVTNCALALALDIFRGNWRDALIRRAKQKSPKDMRNTFGQEKLSSKWAKDKMTRQLIACSYIFNDFQPHRYLSISYFKPVSHKGYLMAWSVPLSGSSRIRNGPNVDPVSSPPCRPCPKDAW